MKPSECKNVAKMSKKGKILKQGLYQKGKISILCHSQKRSIQGPGSGAYKNFRSGLWTYQNKCIKLYFYFIYYSLLILYYI